MSLVMSIKTYLAKLKAEETEGVPTLRDLAKCMSVDEDTLSNISNNKIKLLSLRTGGKIIAEMRRLGHDMQVSDLIEYVEDNN